MRFIHTADWHLGRVLHDMSLEPFHEQFLDHIVELTREERPDGFLLAGDVFDRAIAPTTSIELLEDALARLVEHTRIVIIPGNHDSATRLGFGSQLFRDRIEIVSRFQRIGTPVVFGAGDEAVNVYPIPYLEPDIARYALADEVTGADESPALPRSHEGVMSGALRRVNQDLSNRPGHSIVMVHAFVTGGTPSDSERDISVGGAQNISVTAFENLGYDAPLPRTIDYVAAGHLHRPQNITAQIPIRYSGSPMPFSFSEASDHKTTSIVTIEAGRVDVETVDVPQPYELRTIRGTVEELTQSPPAWAERAYVSVEVTDQLRPDRLHARIRAIYPRALVIRHTGFSRHLGSSSPRQVVEPVDMAEMFFTKAFDRPLDDAERAIIHDTWTTMRAEAVQ
ncbi:MAG: exonuclease SbcCD subunit D [Actinomycetaceae bacterium]|nr:exonuclease SbcCD subunit D [Actinomycetaceae bacterium]